MANHIAVGAPANAAEKWAFRFLKENLPADYQLITNVEVCDEKGQPFEVDAIIIGRHAVYLMDVKGYQGNLIAAKDAWSFDGRPVENPLPKLNHNVRILASHCRKKTTQGQHTPWCQSVIFITGGEGGAIMIDRKGHDLPVYDQHEIVQSLQSTDYLTSKVQNPLADYQKDLAIRAICDFTLLKESKNTLAGYSKERLVSNDGLVDTWVVRPIEKALPFEYWMQVVDLSACKPEAANLIKAQFKHEFQLLNQFANLPEVPTPLNYWDDGEYAALICSQIEGTKLSEQNLTGDAALAALKSITLALSIISEESPTPCSKLSPDNIYAKDEGEVTFASVSDLFRGDAAIGLPKQVADLVASHLRLAVEDMAKFDGLADWLADAAAGEDVTLEELLAVFEPTPVAAGEWIDIEQLAAGDVISGKYELISCLGRGTLSTVWKVKHLIGEYECSMKILKDLDDANEFAKKEFEILRCSFHPNIVRIFDLDRVQGTNTHYLIGQYLNGTTYAEVDSALDALKYFKEILSALQYLHRIQIIHKDVKPKNIVIDSGKAYLIDFNISAVTSTQVGTLCYKDPLVSANGWTKFSDVYSLVLSYLEIATGFHPFSKLGGLPNADAKIALPNNLPGVSAKTKAKLTQVINHEVDLEGIPDYIAWFGLSDTINAEIPAEIREKWGIRDGYMLKTLLAMIADGQPRSRKVVIANTVRSNKIVGSKSTKGSINSSISQLKKAGVIEDLGLKIRLTDDFMSDWVLLLG
jgi:RIO-like serine/threonine protein kinase